MNDKERFDNLKLRLAIQSGKAMTACIMLGALEMLAMSKFMDAATLLGLKTPDAAFILMSVILTMLTFFVSTIQGNFAQIQFRIDCEIL